VYRNCAYRYADSINWVVEIITGNVSIIITSPPGSEKDFPTNRNRPSSLHERKGKYVSNQHVFLFFLIEACECDFQLRMRISIFYRNSEVVIISL